MRKGDRKVLVISLDGASFDLLGPWIHEGRLPNIAWMIKNGVSGHLTSAFPPVTPVAWASFMTGKNPGKHGITDFELRQKGNYGKVIANSSNIDGETLWAILSKANKRVGVVHVPLTYPPEKVNGLIVSGFVMSPAVSTYPPNLAKKLFSRVSGYEKIYSDIQLVHYTPGMDDAYLKSIYNATVKEVDATFFLMENYEWDFFITHFYFGDQVQHFLWKYIDPKHPAYDPESSKKCGDLILMYYQRIDDIIGKILTDLSEDATIIVMSDHGFGPLYKRVYINHWLRKLGLLKLKESRKPWQVKVGLTQEGIVKFVEKHGLAKFLIRNVPRPLARIWYWRLPLSRPTLEDIDYSQTKAYSMGHVGQIFINVKGRDPEGIIEPGEYEEFRNYLIRELYELRDPEDGEKIVDRVFRKEEVYWGPHLDWTADLLFVMRNMSYITQESPWEFGPNLDSLMDPSGDLVAWHRMNGLFIVTGPEIRKRVSIENARIIDIAPTILYIFGIPIPSDMDGRVLKEIFKPDSHLAKNEIQYRSIKASLREEYVLTEDEEKEIKRRLKELGYLG